MVYLKIMKTKTSPCPITKVVLLLSDAWTMMILYQLNTKSMRFCELERALNGISTRTLTLKLHKLIEEDMVTKDALGMYMTTKRGKGLRIIKKAMRRYEETYL